MEVNYRLDDDEGIDPTDPLGDLILCDNEGGSLVLESTFIDVWLLSIIKAILNLFEEKNVQVEILEENYCIEVVRKSNRLTFLYESEKINTDYDEALLAFKNVSETLIKELSKYEKADDNAAIGELKKLIEKIGG